MFSVETIIREDALTPTMEAMRTWLDHRRFSPTTFRYRFGSAGLAVSVEFSAEIEAAYFAKAFGGTVKAALPVEMAA